MKRFHVHIAVDDMQRNIEFYTSLFGQHPDRQRHDYAQWLLAEPAVNFAISRQEQRKGVDHFGFQVDSPQALEQLRQRADSAANGDVIDQGQTSCCYALSRKYWTLDPQGLAWEHFHTLSEAPERGDASAFPEPACCVPLSGTENQPDSQKGVCCLPALDTATRKTCCLTDST